MSRHERNFDSREDRYSLRVSVGIWLGLICLTWGVIACIIYAVAVL